MARFSCPTIHNATSLSASIIDIPAQNGRNAFAALELRADDSSEARITIYFDPPAIPLAHRICAAINDAANAQPTAPAPMHLTAAE